MQQPSIALSVTPTTLSVAQGASGVATVSIARTNFTGAVTLSTTTPAPAGVTVTFGPATTGNSATVTIAASSTAAVTSFALAVTGTGTGVTGGTTLGVNITSGNNNTGGATATPVVATGSPWYNEEDIRLDSTGTLGALSVTIVVQRTPGIGLNGAYNTVGGSILQTTTVTPRPSPTSTRWRAVRPSAPERAGSSRPRPAAPAPPTRPAATPGR